jgi:hypothetical protein
MLCEGSRYHHHTTHEVDVCPIQGYQFGRAQAGPERKLQQVAPLAGCVREDRGLFLLRERVDIVLRLRRLPPLSK